MLLKEAKEILKDNGYLVEAARGKTNIEDFNKMKQEVSAITHLAGTCFEFITTNWGEYYDDSISQMCITPYSRKGYSYDTGKPGFKRYRKLDRQEAEQIVLDNKTEIEKLGFKVQKKKDYVCIYMPKTPLDAKPEIEDGETVGYWSANVGDGRFNYIIYGVRYMDNGKEQPSNIKRIAERFGERKFNMYYSVDTIKKYSTYNSLVTTLSKLTDDSIASEDKLEENYDSYFVVTDRR